MTRGATRPCPHFWFGSKNFNAQYPNEHCCCLLLPYEPKTLELSTTYFFFCINICVTPAGAPIYTTWCGPAPRKNWTKTEKKNTHTAVAHTYTSTQQQYGIWIWIFEQATWRPGETNVRFSDKDTRVSRNFNFSQYQHSRFRWTTTHTLWPPPLLVADEGDTLSFLWGCVGRMMKIRSDTNWGSWPAQIV